MKVSFKWLAGFFQPGAVDALGPEKLAEALTMQGLPVDEVRLPFAEFSGVVLGRVLAARPHPRADRLTLCTVAAGPDSVEREVVCGAPNVEIGAIYPYAMPGARLPGGREIRKARIRGVDSEGMLCSAPELGLDALGSSEGIWAVPGARESDLGRDAWAALALGDAVLEVDVTSNRGDALSHWGIAREIQRRVGARAALPGSPGAGGDGGGRAGATAAGAQDGPGTTIEVEIRDEEGCPLYFGRVVEGVRPGPSPGWVQARLLALGQRPISNLVDATNFVMLECGQPLHPFDLARLAGPAIVVRRARAGERLETLDGRERVLDPEITVIADRRGAVAIGGVMGGIDSEVTGETQSVLLEAAHFDRVRIGRTSRRLGLQTEASVRFSRGVDPAIAGWALDRAAGLTAEWAGGRIGADRVGLEKPRPLADPLPLRLPRLAAVLGRPVTGEEAQEALSALGIGTRAGDDRLEATVPSWRFDLGREIDLIEEVARVTGYESIPLAVLPAPAVAPAPPEGAQRDARIGACARGLGFDEARTTSFVREDALGPGLPIDKMVEIRNPISKADRFLRPYIIATLGRAVVHNLKRGARRVKLYEIGHGFSTGDGAEAGLRESRRLGLVAAGARAPLDWSAPEAAAYDFFDLKGDIEDLLLHAAGARADFVAGQRPYLHPGRQAEILAAGEAGLGFCGQLHPEVAGTWGTDAPVLVAEIELEALPEAPSWAGTRPVPRAPAVERDLALVVSEGEAAADVIAAVRAAGIEELAEIRVFDRYTGPQVGAGRYSLGLRLTFQADRTLTDEDVDARVEGLVRSLHEARGYRLR